jgi:hypothetical protein
LRTYHTGNHEESTSRKITIYILELKKSFPAYMLELPNITLTAFLFAFVIAFVFSLLEKNYATAIASFLIVASILPIKYYMWKKIKVQIDDNEKKHKVIVIKRK